MLQARLAGAALLPAALSVLIYFFEKTTAAKRMGYGAKQLLYGILFGGLAILGTEFGIPISGAQVNSRDGAVLTAGLLFGAPAGLIAGCIGGIERWFAVYWGVGAFTRTACTVSTLLAGVYAACLRKFMFEDRKPAWSIAFAVGVVMEVFHMLMVFITNMNAPEQALTVVRACTVPMLLINGLSVMFSTLLLIIVSGKFHIRRQERVHISQTIQEWLLGAVLVAFLLTSFFVVRLQSNIASTQTDDALSTALDEVEADIRDASDNALLVSCRLAVNEIKQDDLATVASRINVSEINVVNQSGIIVDSTNPDFLGFDMHTGKQSAEFLCLLVDENEFVQELGKISHSSGTRMKYAGVRTKTGFVQIGYDESDLRREVDTQVKGIARNRHVGNSGYVLMFDTYGRILSAPVGFRLELPDILRGGKLPEEGTTFSLTINGTDVLCRCKAVDTYSVLSVLPREEAYRIRDIAIYVNTFLEILVCALIFGMIYMLIRRIVVDRLLRVNGSLARITGGDLNEVVDVRSNAEFASLSDDINSTVSTLKRYIDEASSRIDAELEAARSIQASALPSVKNAIGTRNDVELCPFMDTAKEVGGDFYDFYITGGDTLHFMIADVSGKGIPAAMFMMRAKTELRSLTESGIAPAEVFSQGNDHLCDGNDAGMFVTAWQGSLDLRTGVVRYVNAGHNHPLVRHGNGAFTMVREKCNLVLGGMEGIPYREQTLKLEKGDTLFLYTDGVTEATNAQEELFGNDRLLEAASDCGNTDMRALCTFIKSRVDSFVGEAPQFDDITMLAIRFIGQPDDWSMTSEQAALTDIAGITEAIEEKLHEVGCPPKMIMQFAVAIDEIYSNIVKYAYPADKPGFVRLTLHETVSPHKVSLTFEDEGVPYNPLSKSSPDTTLSAEERAVGGLGMLIVRKTMDHLLYVYENGHNMFTIEKDL